MKCHDLHTMYCISKHLTRIHPHFVCQVCKPSHVLENYTSAPSPHPSASGGGRCPALGGDAGAARTVTARASLPTGARLREKRSKPTPSRCAGALKESLSRRRCNRTSEKVRFKSAQRPDNELQKRKSCGNRTEWGSPAFSHSQAEKAPTNCSSSTELK